MLMVKSRISENAIMFDKTTFKHLVSDEALVLQLAAIIFPTDKDVVISPTGR